MSKVYAAAIFAFNSICCLAGPNQIDILGLGPGVSDPLQVQQASVHPKSRFESIVFLEIGGHKIPCMVEFLNGKLAALGCLTGKGSKKNQTYTEASNSDIYRDLVVGFTKKFGKPDFVKSNPVRTRVGVEYEVSIATWIDKHGNKLLLYSMFDTVDMGLITLESSDFLRRETENRDANEARKKF